MTTLHFVRHGETDWNRQGRFQGIQDIPLNEEGRRQARYLASVWDEPAEVLVTSPLLRARETAEILGASLGLSLDQSDPRLVERDFGQGSGLTLDERLLRFPDGVIPGVEDSEALFARALHFLDTMARNHQGRRIVAVSHGGFINAVLTLVSGGEMGMGKTILRNVSVSTLIHRAGGWVVQAAGRTLGSQPD
jgi:broad specificity phosphatase PhoE